MNNTNNASSQGFANTNNAGILNMNSHDQTNSLQQQYQQQLEQNDSHQGQSVSSSSTSQSHLQYQQPNLAQYQQYQQQPQQPQQSPQQQHALYFQSNNANANLGTTQQQYGQSLPQDFNYLQQSNQPLQQNTAAIPTTNSSTNPNFNQQQFSELMYNSFLSHLAQKPTQSQQVQQPQQSPSQPQLGLNTATTNAAVAAATGNAGAPSYMNPSIQRYYQNNMATTGYPSSLDSNPSLLQQQYHQQQLHQQMQQQQLVQQQQQLSQQHQQQQMDEHNQQDHQQQHELSNDSIDQLQVKPQKQKKPRKPRMTKLQKQQQQEQLLLGQSIIDTTTTSNNNDNIKNHSGKNNKNESNGKNGKNNQKKKLSTTQSRIEKRKQLKKQGPKRPSSAYFLFSMSIRNDLLQQFPEAKVPELSKLASARWKELTDDEKKPFYEEFRTNWDKYRVLRDEYDKTLPPKRPSGPFIQFTQEIRPITVKENPGKSLIEITKLIGQKWRTLDPVEKVKYTDAYKVKLKEWEKCYLLDDEKNENIEDNNDHNNVVNENNIENDNHAPSIIMVNNNLPLSSNMHDSQHILDSTHNLLHQPNTHSELPMNHSPSLKTE